MRTSLVETPVGPALRCPVCGLYTTQLDAANALRSLSVHLRKKHPGYVSGFRYCNGPSHEVRPARVPTTAFGRRKRCLACERWSYREERNAGYVPVETVRALVERLVERYGTQRRAALACGFSDSCLSKIRNHQTKMARRDLAAAVIVALRADEEVGN